MSEEVRPRDIALAHEAEAKKTGQPWSCICLCCRSLRGGRKRALTLTPAHQRNARKHVRTKSLQRAGAIGAQVTIARYGHRALFERSRAWRLNNPTQPELKMIGVLATLKLKTEREYELGQSLLTVDFYLPETNQAIEVKGKVHKVFQLEKREVWKARKLAKCSELGIEVLTIDYTELRKLAAVIDRVRAFTKGAK